MCIRDSISDIIKSSWKSNVVKDFLKQTRDLDSRWRQFQEKGAEEQKTHIPNVTTFKHRSRAESPQHSTAVTREWEGLHHHSGNKLSMVHSFLNMAEDIMSTICKSYVVLILTSVAVINRDVPDIQFWFWLSGRFLLSSSISSEKAERHQIS